MNIIKRITTAFSASIDSAVRQIENHDALVVASINHARHHVAQTQVRLARVQKEGEQLGSQLQQLHEDEARWTDRARELAMDDDEKQNALACLKRRNQCLQQIRHSNVLVEKQKVLEDEMATQLGKMQARLNEVKLEHNQMRSRSANVEVHRVVNELNYSGGESLDDIFDRWDIKLTESEMWVGSDEVMPVDPLESQFIAKESQAALDAELAAMRQEGEKNHD